jgi:hypothetical protein
VRTRQRLLVSLARIFAEHRPVALLGSGRSVSVCSTSIRSLIGHSRQAPELA